MKQRDPLSPHLFALCMELLEQSIHGAIKEGSWKPVKASRNGPRISHIFFVADLILFDEAMMRQPNTMAKIMNEFYGVSGQKINLQKSNFFASRNIDPLLKEQLHQTFQIPITTDLGLYLGMEGKLGLCLTSSSLK